MKFILLGCSSALSRLKGALCRADRLFDWLIADKRLQGIETPVCFNWLTRLLRRGYMGQCSVVYPGVLRVLEHPLRFRDALKSSKLISTTVATNHFDT